MYTLTEKRKYAKRLRRHQTAGERALKGLYLIGFKPQQVVGGYIVDWYHKPFRVAVEVDGSVHDKKHHRKADRARDKRLRGYGVYTIRVRDAAAQKHSLIIFIKVMYISTIWYLVRSLRV